MLAFSLTLGGIGTLRPMSNTLGYSLIVLGVMGMIATLVWGAFHYFKRKSNFPCLNFEQLKKIAKAFVNKYPEFPINSITLYYFRYDELSETK